MSGFGLILSIVSLLVATIAWWMAWRARKELSDINRERYYLEQKVKSFASQIDSTVEPLRIQTALLAVGKPVSDQLIRTGRLYHEISAKEAQGIFTGESTSGHVLWLDVRTSAEFSKRHIPRATLIPVEHLEMRYEAEIPLTIEKIIVYCASGDRSRLAADFLSRHNFGHVYHIKDGLQGWAGPTEGNEPLGLIQIVSKPKQATQMDSMKPTSVHSW